MVLAIINEDGKLLLERLFFLYGFSCIHFYLLKIKSAATEATAQKTQTPIVAKPTPQKAYAFIPTESEFAFLSNSFYGSKEYNIPIKNYTFCIIKLVWHR